MSIAMADVLPAFVDTDGMPIRLVFRECACGEFVPGMVVEYRADEHGWFCGPWVLLPFFLRGLLLSGCLVPESEWPAEQLRIAERDHAREVRYAAA
jgi:hypothetical protein